MPTYDYICDACGHEFEAYESITVDASHRLPRVQAAQAAPEDRPGCGDPVQGVGLLPDRLSQRVVQEGGRGGQAVERAGETGGRFEIRASRRARSEERAGQAGAQPRRATHDQGTLSDLFEVVSQIAALDDLPSFPVLLRALPADRPRPLDRREATRSRRRAPQNAADESGGSATTGDARRRRMRG